MMPHSHFHCLVEGVVDRTYGWRRHTLRRQRRPASAIDLISMLASIYDRDPHDITFELLRTHADHCKEQLAVLDREETSVLRKRHRYSRISPYFDGLMKEIGSLEDLIRIFASKEDLYKILVECLEGAFLEQRDLLTEAKADASLWEKRYFELEQKTEASVGARAHASQVLDVCLHTFCTCVCIVCAYIYMYICVPLCMYLFETFVYICIHLHVFTRSNGASARIRGKIFILDLIGSYTYINACTYYTYVPTRAGWTMLHGQGKCLCESVRLFCKKERN